MQKYQVVGACGEGFYGTVFKCKHKPSSSIVAIKQFKGKEDYATKREIETLSKLKHPNIINLREVFREQGKLHMVFEFLETDLLNALDNYPKGMPEKLVKIYMTQLCRALEYCHQRCVIHRDLKPENLLVAGNVHKPDPKRSLKLCDFGEARDVGPGDKFLSGIIGTRWYRAPEILVGAKVANASKANDASSFSKVTRPKLLKYDFQVDMWGAGCIMGELLLANPMFPADTDIQQLEMVQVYGTPQQLTKRFQGKCSATCLSALKGLLDVSPHKRLSAPSALQHQFLGGRSKTSLLDSFSAASSFRQRPKFQPQFNHGVGMGDIDEEIDTESDIESEEDLDSDMPQEDDYNDDDDDAYDNNFEEVAAVPQHDDVDDDGDGYSDDEFEDGYSDDEFEEAFEEAATVKPQEIKKPKKKKARQHSPEQHEAVAAASTSSHSKPAAAKSRGAKEDKKPQKPQHQQQPKKESSKPSKSHETKHHGTKHHGKHAAETKSDKKSTNKSSKSSRQQSAAAAKARSSKKAATSNNTKRQASAKAGRNHSSKSSSKSRGTKQAVKSRDSKVSKGKHRNSRNKKPLSTRVK